MPRDAAMFVEFGSGLPETEQSLGAPTLSCGGHPSVSPGQKLVTFLITPPPRGASTFAAYWQITSAFDVSAGCGIVHR